MDGKPISLVTGYVYVPSWIESFSDKWKTKESIHAGGIAFYTKSPVAGNENGQFAPGAKNPDAEPELIDDLMEAIAVANSASGSSSLKVDVKEFLEDKEFISALEALDKTLTAIDVTASAGKTIKEKVGEHKNEASGSQADLSTDAVSSDSKELKPAPVHQDVYHKYSKDVIRTDGVVTQYTTSEGSTREAGSGKPDTIRTDHYKTPR